jgi:DNA replication protein DnaC
MSEQTNTEIAGIMAGFDVLIDAAPETPISAPEMPVKPAQILAADGWPKRMREAVESPTGAEWLKAYERASKVTRAGGIVILHGTRGAGKTRMAAEIAKAKAFPAGYRLKESSLGGTTKELEKRAIYRTALTIFLDIRETYGKGKRSEKEVINSLCRPGLLVIDELQERGETPWEDRLLTHIIDRRYSEELATILIANLTRDELKATLSPSIIDRIAENGARIDATWPSFRRTKQPTAQ